MVAGKNGVREDADVVRRRMGSFLGERLHSRSRCFVIQWFHWLGSIGIFFPVGISLGNCGLEWGAHALSAQMLSVPFTTEAYTALPPCSWAQRNGAVEQLEGVCRVIIMENKISWRAVKLHKRWTDLAERGRCCAELGTVSGCLVRLNHFLCSWADSNGCCVLC